MTNLYMDKYAEDDTLLNDYIERGMKTIAWKMFEHQEDWLHMSGELGEGRFPQMKSFREVYDAFDRAFDDWIGWLYGYMFERYVRETRLGNVDLGEEMEWGLRERMGDEEFERWESAAKRDIYDDYAHMLGEKKATEIFNKAWGENWEDKEN